MKEHRNKTGQIDVKAFLSDPGISNEVKARVMKVGRLSKAELANDKKAANAYRLQQAQILIEEVADAKMRIRAPMRRR